MKMKGAAGQLVLFMVVFLARADGAETTPTTSQVCQGVITKMTDCLTYVEGKATSPTAGCCGVVKTTVQSNAECLCQFIALVRQGSQQVKSLGIQEAKVSQLPSSCGLHNVSSSNCSSFDWGTINIDDFMITFIRAVTNIADRYHYYPALDELLMRVNYFGTCHDATYWMEIPIMGEVFATLHQRPLVILSQMMPMLCLPLYTTGGPSVPSYDELDGIALVGNNNHFIPSMGGTCSSQPGLHDTEPTVGEMVAVSCDITIFIFPGFATSDFLSVIF